MRSRALAALLVLSAAPAAATDVELQLEAGVQYDDNVFSSSQDPQDDVSLRITPRLKALDDEGHLNWEVRYRPRYRKFDELGELDGWDQDAYGMVRWRFSDRTSVQLLDHYTDYAGFDRLLTEEVLADGTIDTGFLLGQQRVKQNVILGSLEHRLGRQQSLEFSVTHYDTTFEGSSESSSDAVSGSYLYDLDRTDSLGAVLSWQRQTLGAIQGFSEEKDTNYYNLALQWFHAFDPTLILQAQGGPAWVEQELDPVPEVVTAPRFPFASDPNGLSQPVRASSCPPTSGGFRTLDPSCDLFDAGTFTNISFLLETAELQRVGDQSTTSKDLTYFANVSLSKTWQDYLFVLRYERTAATTSQVSGDVRDVLTAYVRWVPSDLWTFSATLTYEMRETQTGNRVLQALIGPTTVQGVSDVAETVAFRTVEDDQNLRTSRYFLNLSVNRLVTRRTTLVASAYVSREQRRDDVSEARETDAFGIFLGVRYTFDRFQLPI